MSLLNSVSVNNITKKYEKAARLSLSNINFNITAGDRIGVLGPNGAGKSTLISILTGIFEPTSGNVEYRDKNNELITGDALKMKMGYVPQDFAVYDELNLHQNISYFGALYGLTKEKVDDVSSKLIKEFDLEDATQKKVKAYSGGMKRRLNLMLSLLHEPEILFLDEPTAGVDVQNKHAIIQFLNRLSEKGTTLIYTSHHMDEAEEICNRIILLNKGTIVADDGLKSLLAKHPTENLTSIFLKLTNQH